MNQILIINFLKTFIVSIGTIYLDFKIINEQKYYKKNIIKLLSVVFLVNVISFVIKKVANYSASVICLDIFLSLIWAKFTRNKIGYSILVNTISFSINNIICMIAVVLSYVILTVFNNDNPIIKMLFISSFYFIFLIMLVKVKKIKYGIAILIKNRDNEFFEVLILNVSAIILLAFFMLNSLAIELIKPLFVYIVIFSIMMFVTIQKSLQLYYKQKMLVKDLEETKSELEKKKEEVAELEKENLEFSKVSHSIAHKQRALEYKLNELSMKSEIADEIDLKERIENLNAGLSAKQVVVLDKTEIPEIDDMLAFMQSECVKNKIDFQLQLSGNIYTMINHYVSKDELEILLADHIKNAIIAIGYGDNINKSILVRLGKLDGNYGLYVYDSGIEFETETLLNLGKKPSTTHKDSGGTGMGFMNTFDTLRKHKASFVIEEYGKPVKDNFTKALKFKFDKKEEFKICSYRAEEIKNVDKENTLVVEKL